MPDIRVVINYDQDLEDPSAGRHESGWNVRSFSRKHRNYVRPSQLGISEYIAKGETLPEIEDEEMAAKFEAGLAFFVSYYEHGSCAWMLTGTTYPGVEFTWDGVRVAGVVEWSGDIGDLGSVTYADRAEDAATFLDVYTMYCNSEGYYYCIEDENGDVLDSCGGFLGASHLVTELARVLAAYGEFVVAGEATYLEDDIRTAVCQAQRESRMAAYAAYAAGV